MMFTGLQPRFVFGLDLGQTVDPSALVFLECYGQGDQTIYHCLGLRRWELHTSYPLIVEHLRLLFLRAPFTRPGKRARLVIDTTGVGKAVFDMLTQAGLNANLTGITITGGAVVTPRPGGYNVPKRDLVGAVQVVLQTGRLRIASEIPDAKTLTEELSNFRVKFSETGRDTYGNSTDSLEWRERPHDDLVLALAVALWSDARPGVRFGQIVGV
jgi:hypothetical protein